MKLSAFETIVDEKKFVEAHTSVVERNGNNKWFQSYKERLKKYHESKRQRNNADKII